MQPHLAFANPNGPGLPSSTPSPARKMKNNSVADVRARTSPTLRARPHISWLHLARLKKGKLATMRNGPCGSLRWLHQSALPETPERPGPADLVVMHWSALQLSRKLPGATQACLRFFNSGSPMRVVSRKNEPQTGEVLAAFPAQRGLHVADRQNLTGVSRATTSKAGRGRLFSARLARRVLASALWMV